MPDMNKKTILVVDDDHEIVRAITITLEREGYHVLNAYDGLAGAGLRDLPRSASDHHRRDDAEAGRTFRRDENSRKEKSAHHHSFRKGRRQR